MCRTSLASYKVPQYFKFLRSSELPLTATGKVQKEKLRELFVADLDAVRPASGGEEARGGEAGP
jgi:acyl-CoA synthetase (AMP-forming)/AMP-acid ligase II